MMLWCSMLLLLPPDANYCCRCMLLLVQGDALDAKIRRAEKEVSGCLSVMGTLCRMIWSACCVKVTVYIRDCRTISTKFQKPG
jgi:hypothetical protein